MTPTPEEIEKAKTPNGDYTRDQLAAWGVPPPKGWKKALLDKHRDEHGGMNTRRRSQDWSKKQPRRWRPGAKAASATEQDAPAEQDLNLNCWCSECGQQMMAQPAAHTTEPEKIRTQVGWAIDPVICRPCQGGRLYAELLDL